MSTTSNRRPSRGNAGGRRTYTQGRKSSLGRTNRNTRRRKPKYDYMKIAIIGVILILIITGTVYAFSNRRKPEKPEITIETETQLERSVTVDGISITGMSKEQARETMLEHYTWGMKVAYEDAETPYEVKNLIEGRIDALLNEIFAGEPKEIYTLNTDGLDAEVEAEVQVVANQWDVSAQNGAIAGFDKDTGEFIYSGERTGKLIDREQLEADMLKAISGKQFQTVLTAKGTLVEPEITEAQAKQMYKVIGSMTTKATSNSDRNTNIQLAASALDGLIIQPGEEFSFNTTTGNRTLERGYKPAGAYVNGELVEEPGGGVCQVSSTLYNAVVFSGLTTTERHAHSYEPSYVTPGEDAMVSYDGYAGPDMKFINNTKDAVAIRAKFQDRELTISIVGIQILEDGERWYMESKKVADLDPPAPVYEENQTLQLEEEKEVKAATPGSRWETNLIKEKDGVVVSNEFFHKSTYRGKPATIQRNTSGVVIPDPTESSESTESMSESESITEEETTSQPTQESTTESTRESIQGPGERPTQAPTAPQSKPSVGPVGPTAAPETSPAPGVPTEANMVPPNPFS